MTDELANQIASNIAQIREDIASMKGSLDNLAGPYGRVTQIESWRKEHEERHWVQGAIIIPASVAITAMLRRMGINI